MENFVWFQGVIEDRNDPLKIGRVKIRCYGYHTENKQDLPTEDLPWATPITPVTSASVNGIGETPLGPVTGTWVVGFFRDGSLAQNPVYFGTIPAISSMLPNPNVGFSDPMVSTQRKISLTNRTQTVWQEMRRLKKRLSKKKMTSMRWRFLPVVVRQVKSAEKHPTTHSIHSTK